MSLRLQTVLSSDAALAAVVTTDRSATTTFGNEHKRGISGCPASYFSWPLPSSATSRKLPPLRRLPARGRGFLEVAGRRLLRWGSLAGSGSRPRLTGRQCGLRERRS